MIMDIYPHNRDLAWLRRALAAAETYHQYYTSRGHHVPHTGLNRFFDFGASGTAPPEVDEHEKDEEGRVSSSYKPQARFRAATQQQSRTDSTRAIH